MPQHFNIDFFLQCLGLIQHYFCIILLPKPFPKQSLHNPPRVHPWKHERENAI